MVVVCVCCPTLWANTNLVNESPLSDVMLAARPASKVAAVPLLHHLPHAAALSLLLWLLVYESLFASAAPVRHVQHMCLHIIIPGRLVY